MQLAYKAVTNDGRIVTGSAQAASRDELIASLRKQHLRPLAVAVSKGRSTRHSFFGNSKRVKLQDLVIFTRQLSTMISAGVPIVRSLTALQNDSESPYLREALRNITKDVQAGHPLADAFAKYPRIFSEVYVNMVRAGEAGGILDDILKRLALQVELDASIRKKIKSAMMYPIVILTVTVLAFFGIMLFIVPKLAAILISLGGPNAKLPVYTQVLLDASSFCVSSSIIRHIPGLAAIPLLNKAPNLIFLALIASVIGYYVYRYVQTPKGKYKFHALLLRTPIIKTVILKIAIARFSRTFASLMGSGVSVLEALAVTGGAIGNKVIEAELADAAEQVKAGKPLSEPIGQSPHFPPIVAQMLLVGEETGQIDTVLVKIADFYEEEVAVLIDGLAAVIEPLMIIVLGSAVGLIAASVMGPIANLSKAVGPTN
ncbi:MAG: Type secretion system protein [Candidatus Saccharibacteria bacterium]|nr:Type secretion system protein [Candidatus Saccharibacteria bacterium]